MQRFVAELSHDIQKTEFESSWSSGLALAGTKPSVTFDFAGRRVSVLIDSGVSDRWPSASFYNTFSAAIRRIDTSCNIRWL